MTDSDAPAPAAIRIRGAHQNNLRDLDVDFPLGRLTVVTGVSGSGKSSLVFDTLYAEGQRRYVETFSPYARQFLDRMDKPAVGRIEGIPPAIAIDQTNPVRTSRSTVGTMTELNDHLKLLFARAARLHCAGCGRPVVRDSPDSIVADLAGRAAAAGDPRVAITFPLAVPDNFSEAEIEGFLHAQGYTRVHARAPGVLHVVQDRLRLGGAERARIVEALEAALLRGRGRVDVHVLDADAPAPAWRYSTGLHCPDCERSYAEPLPSTFSFNSPIGACETCRGFGRVIGVDYGLVIPDAGRTLDGGAIKPFQTESFRECQDDLVKYGTRRGLPLDVPWREMTEADRGWVLDGDPAFRSWEASSGKHWYGVRRFFEWLESKAYKMHIRVLLSKYRAYTPCAACEGARLKPEALDFRLGSAADAARVLAPAARFHARSFGYDRATLARLDGLTIHDLMLAPIARLRAFFAELHLPGALDEASDLVLAEVRARLGFLGEVGLGYLTLDRQSRTLSGGEVQRINLTTALGTSLVNTLFVLDEPSIGLHPRDMHRVIAVMRRLRAQGNTLVVVEHDPAIMLAADRLLDIGPGPGERGGRVVFDGAPLRLARARDSLTADYLLGRRTVAAHLQPRAVTAATPRLELRGAAEHNLKGVDVAIPLGRLVVVTGVSGSGKSTLVQDVLYPALAKRKGQPVEAAGAHAGLAGDAALGAVVLVDQSPIGKSSRSNPASCVGAFDAIRKLFAATPAAQERGYTAGTFSFNAGTGRCPACAGSGFEHVEMQFLSDVYLRCPDCDGRRYRAEVLEATVAGHSIADVLDLTVSEALAFFAPLQGGAEVARALAPLAEVGLEYVRLGQPVPTLSGGEAQRLKLAGHLSEAAQAARRRSRKPAADAAAATAAGTLFIFDEPTTGLHFDDIARLLRAFATLLDAGHSLLVIEHNLDVIGAADWIIDLGPEGGDAGGELVCAGTPAEVIACPASHTGRALAEYRTDMTHLATTALRAAAAAAGVAEVSAGYAAFVGQVEAGGGPEPAAPTAIRILHAREHNLKNVSVDIPHGGFTVITGPSGSGKSTLAFDIVFNEGQRRYLESLNAYARQFVQPAARPDVDAIQGIPPTVAIEQRMSRGGHKSTVATATEIYHFLRLAWMTLGTQHCPGCGVPIAPQSEDAIAAQLLRAHRGRAITLLAPLVLNRKGLYTELARWARGKGYARLRVDGEWLPTSPWPRLDRFREHTLELPVAEALAVDPAHEAELRGHLAAALEHGKGVVHVLDAAGALAVYSTRRACPQCGTSFPELDPRLFSFNSRHGWCLDCQGTGVSIAGFVRDERVSEEAIDRVLDDWLDGRGAAAPCAGCHGERLNPVARAVRLGGLSLGQLTARPVRAVAAFFDTLALDAREAAIARDIVDEVRTRLAFLERVGLGYLTLARAAPTLSGGEAQRIRLAAQLGSNLQGVAYVLDEPTIGLHPRDNRILLDVLEALEAKGNTLLVVEHDEDTIRRAHHVIDLGPGAGRLGGEVVATGSAAELAANPASVTGRCLAAPLRHPLQPRRAVGRYDPAIEIRGAALHNLRDVDLRVPLGRLSVVTGVSGSGKSTLAREVLHANLLAQVAGGREAGRARRAADRAAEPAATGRRRRAPVESAAVVAPRLHGCRSMSGWEAVDRVLEVDQTPIGKTPRSCPATYVGFWDAIRRLFADTQEARVRGWGPGRFSFNTAGGRCPVCEGQGVVRVEMSFLPDVKLPCEVCGGARFNQETREARLRGRSIGEVLAMSVDEAVEFFAAHPSLHHALRLLADVGLGYLTLGQPSPTLSGGEAQRIKLVTELAKVRAVPAAPGARGARVAPHTFYVLDEPTVGLHMVDVDKLIRVLHRLVDAGNTVVLIEHNLDLIAEADWIVDLGPEGGDDGGRIVVQGPPDAVIAAAATSHTGRVLAEFMASRGQD
ncbi:UvrA family protein [Plasticicumulans lactativorans]|uniref:UvrABC system protein A n=1 Tax=Plasticicumulans lactativorans TaxID=1133106 RepID=A0A4R2LQE4_9GAMM|nr:excinuclease ABC subunit UvrA [Plasticicumulans lactativorans]TCO81764.1 UvrA family protein [Plasticicumulans lactativorans]